MNNEDARTILQTIKKLAKEHANQYPELANELLIRLQREGASEEARAEECLSLLALLAFEPTQDDVRDALSELSEICDIEFENVHFFNPQTEQTISFGDLNVFPEVDTRDNFQQEEIKELRRWVDEVLPSVENEFSVRPRPQGGFRP